MPRTPGATARPINYSKELDLIIRQSHEQNTVIIIRLANLQLEVSQLRSELSAVSRLFLALLDDPESRRHASAVAKDFGVGEGSTVKKEGH